MDFSQQIDSEKQLALISIRGKYSVFEFLKFYRDLMMKDNLERLDAIIWDARELVVGHVTISELQSVINAINKGADKRSGGKAAWIVSDELGYGMGRMFELMSEGQVPIEIKVFYDIAEAQKWVLSS